MGEQTGGWIAGDETAKQMLSRALKQRSFLFLPPPLHRVPLRSGNVVEIVGPSPSAKTQILIQATISYVLPREWNGVHYGGLGQMVVFLDLDCRFDVLRLAEMLKHRFMEAKGFGRACQGKKADTSYDEDLLVLCMRRFLYVRCSHSLEFLSILKALHSRIQREQEAYGIQVGVLMIDSIGSFHWIDRVSSSLAVVDNNRKNLSLQNVVETVVQEIRKLLLVHPMLVIATKGTILGDRYSMNESKWKVSSKDDSLANAVSNAQQLPFREFMPSAWQSLVTQRILVRATDDQSTTDGPQGFSTYSLEWLLPQLSSSDRFMVKDAGIVNVS